MAGIGMQPILPKPFKEKLFLAQFEAGMQEVAKELDADFQKTYATWKRKPIFTKKVTTTKSSIDGVVETADEIYTYVSAGTKPHIIEPKKAKALAFNVGGTPKTTPKVIGSGAGSPGTGPVFAMKVHHPGTKARLFDKAIAKKMQKPFKLTMERALKRAVQMSGHKLT